jgi:4-amino-4-deoxy-L-arabinose transferase-like glycosyltransferase
MTQHGFAELLRLTKGDVHPPLYYLILKLTTLVFGTSLVALRLPSILATLGLLVLAVGPIRRLAGARTSGLFAILILSSSGILCFAQEARMYALTTLFVTGASVYGLLAIHGGTRRDFVGLAVFTWLAAMTHYFGLVAVALNGLGLLIAATVRARSRVKPLLVALAIPVVLYLTWLPSFVQQVSRVSHGFWIPPTTWNLVVFGLVAPFTYKFEDVPYPWQAAVAFVLVVVVIATALFLRPQKKAIPTHATLVHLVSVFTLTLGFGLLYSKFLQPIFMPRYLMSCAGLLLLATAIGLCELPRFGQSLLVAALFVGLGFPAWLRVQFDTFGGPFFLLAKHVNNQDDSMPVLLHNDCQALYPSLYALPRAYHVLVTPQDAPFDVSSGGVYDVTRLASTSDLTLVLDANRRVWVVDAEPAGFHVAPAQILAHAGWRQIGTPHPLILPMSWVKVTLTRFERQ